MEAVALPPYLTEEEIDDMCKPLTQPAAQFRFLRDVLHLAVEKKPGGKPLVWRTNVEAVKGPAAAGKVRPPGAGLTGTEPNTAAFQAHLATKKAKRNATTTQRR